MDCNIIYYEAATQFGADAVVRVASDCPLIDSGVMNEVIGLYINNRDKYDYVSNTLERTYPRGLDFLWRLWKKLIGRPGNSQNEGMLPF